MIVTEGFSLDDADYALLECERGTGLLEVNRHAGVAPEENYGIMGHGGSIVLKDGAVRLAAMDQEAVELPIREDVPTAHRHFLDCLHSGEPARNGIEDAIDTLRVCLAFNRSAASGQVEKV
jgi:predicted dehydrogenase